MELGGRGSGYRGIAIRCPGCAEPMRQLALSEAEVDVCDPCGGLWVDWFDGEVRSVAAETLRVSPALPPLRDPKGRNEAVAGGACPRCTRQLVPTRYAVPGVAGSPSTDVEIWRCEDCMGAFLSRTTVEELAWRFEREREEEPRPSAPRDASEEPARVMNPMPWDRLVALLRALFTNRRTPL